MIVENFKKKVRLFFSKPSFALWFWNFTIYFLILISLLSIAGEYNWIDLPLPVESYYIFDQVVALAFLFDYSLRAWSAKKRSSYFFDPFNIIDLLAILPSLIFGFSLGSSLHSVKVLKVVKAVRLLRVLRIFRVFRGLNPNKFHFRR